MSMHAHSGSQSIVDGSGICTRSTADFNLCFMIIITVMSSRKDDCAASVECLIGSS